MDNCNTKCKINKINVLLGNSLELVSYAYSSLFLATPTCKSFKTLSLSGLLCFIIDYQDKARYLILFDEYTYEILFKYELYYNFEQYYQVLSINFHSFEINKGIIGIFFKNNTEANKFSFSLIKFDDESTKKYLEINIQELPPIKTEKELLKKCNIIKNKFANLLKSNRGNMNNIGKVMDIKKMNQLNILNTLTFLKQRGRFSIDKLNDESKNIFKSIGLLQDDLENTRFSLNLFKNIIKEYEIFYNYKSNKDDVNSSNSSLKVYSDYSSPSKTTPSPTNSNEKYEKTNFNTNYYFEEKLKDGIYI